MSNLDSGSKATNPFAVAAETFLKSTDQFVSEGINPGDYYKAVWCRDAAYILKDWFLTGRFDDVMHELLFIWSHQISTSGEKVIYGRGSPELQYRPRVASSEIHEKFQGALPTTIFHGFSEVYGENPDIDSTALMISSTAWILDTYVKSGMTIPPFTPELGVKELKMASLVSSPSTVIDYVVPRMLLAIDNLATRDVDGDGVLEQGCNEDWMDTILRAGKVVYSQGCWILALGHLSSLLHQLGRKEEAQRTLSMAVRAVNAVEDVLWSEGDRTYLDWQDGEQRILTQDAALYLVAVTESIVLHGLKEEGMNNGSQNSIMSSLAKRANYSLDTLQQRIWKEEWPLVTESALEKTGPWVLDPNQYHNHTLWPWTTGIEMLARSRFGRVQECAALLQLLTSKDTQSNMRAFYEWVNPITNSGSGAHPFRTGISAIRAAIMDILAYTEKSKLK